jgi:3-methyladenine DNA glycosylase AlkD
MRRTSANRQRAAKNELERERAALAKAVAGQRTAERRTTVRAWLRAHRDWQFDQIVALAEMFWFAHPRDSDIPIELIGLSKRHIPDLPWIFFERWRNPLSTWDDIDGLGIYVLGPWLASATASRAGKLEQLIRAAEICSRRLALVGTVVLNRRRDTAVPELTLKLVDRVAAERDPLITKAVSWALRELSKTHRERVAHFVEQNRDRLPAIAVREVRNKLQTGLKNPRRAATAGA